MRWFLLESSPEASQITRGTLVFASLGVHVNATNFADANFTMRYGLCLSTFSVSIYLMVATPYFSLSLSSSSSSSCTRTQTYTVGIYVHMYIYSPRKVSPLLLMIMLAPSLPSEETWKISFPHLKFVLLSSAFVL